MGAPFTSLRWECLRPTEARSHRGGRGRPGKESIMANVFETGKKYGAWDTATPAILIVARTAKTAVVEDDDTHDVWRMRVKTRANGDEYMTDSRVPAEWRESYTYEARYKI